MSRRTNVTALVTGLLTAGALWVVAPAGSTGPQPAASQAPAAPTAAQFWQRFGNARWTPDGLVTNSVPDPTEPFGVTSGGAALRAERLPTTDPQQITALSFDFNADKSGGGGGSARLVVCFSDGPACDSYAELGPAQWTAGQWTRVDGLAPSDGVNNIWINGGRYGSCGFLPNTTWSEIVACHTGAAITEIKVVNDSGWLYTTGEQVILNNLVANQVTAAATQPVLAETATVVPVKGRVFVKRRGSKRYRRARSPLSLRFGGVINAERGRVKLYAARGKGHQRGVFRGGKFELEQNESGLVDATLKGALSGCDPTLAQASARRKKRRLWSTANGRFRTAGRHGAATVRGTRWLTEERCNGTYFRVRRGAVKIRDFGRNKTVIVRSGEDYLAKKRKKRR